MKEFLILKIKLFLRLRHENLYFLEEKISHNLKDIIVVARISYS